MCKCTSFIKKAKSEFYLSVTTENLNGPRKFWEAVKSLSVTITEGLPTYVLMESVSLYDKLDILICFIFTGSPIDSSCFAFVHPCPDVSVSGGHCFRFLLSRKFTKL